MVFYFLRKFVAIALVAAALGNAAPTSSTTSTTRSSSRTSTPRTSSFKSTHQPSGTNSLPWNSNGTFANGISGSTFRATTRTLSTSSLSSEVNSSSLGTKPSSSSTSKTAIGTGLFHQANSAPSTQSPSANSTAIVLSRSINSKVSSTSSSSMATNAGTSLRSGTSGTNSSKSISSSSITSSPSTTVLDFLALGLITAAPTASYSYPTDLSIPSTSLSANGTAAHTNAILLAGMLIDVSQDVKKVDNQNRDDFVVKLNKLKDDLTLLRIDLPHGNLNLPDDSTCASKGINLFDLLGCALNKVTDLVGKISGTAPIVLADIEPIAEILGEEGEEIKEKEETEKKGSSASATQSQNSKSSSASTHVSSTISSSASSNSSSFSKISSTTSRNTSTSSFSSSSSSTASGISSQYIIWPTAGANMAGISSSLSSQIGTDNFATISIESTSTIFVAVFPTNSILAQWQKDPNVAVEVDAETTISGDGNADDSSPNCVSSSSSQASSQPARREIRQAEHFYQETESSLAKRGFVWSEPAVPELKFISQPRGKQVWNIDTYTYDTTAGQGISVYVMDTGANMNNPEISGMAGGISWLLPKESFWRKILGKTLTQTDEDGHGSCVVSKVGGLSWGVAKRAHVVVVKMNYKQGFKNSDILRSLELIIKDVKKRASSEGYGKSVVNISLGGPNNSKKQTDAEQKLIQALLAIDVVVVVASGNDKGKPGRSDQVDSYPALLRQSLTDMIIAGSVDVAGARTKYSQGGPFMDISAPGSVDSSIGFGYGIQCASGNSNGWVRKEGTSFAAPAVAGLAAYFMSITLKLKSDPKNLGILPQKVKAFITDPNLAWARQGGDLAISNGLSSPLVSRMIHTGLEARDNTGGPSCIAQSGASEPATPALPPPDSGGSSNTSSVNASSTTLSTSTGRAKATLTSSVTASGSMTTGMPDGAPWLDPTSFCDFGTATYPTISLPSTITDTAKLCAYTSLNPSSAITPKQTSAIPTNRPGIGGVPGCAAVVFGAEHQDCPYGTDGWCNCGGVIVPPLAPTKSGLINCDITIQPTASSCPVNTAYSSSLAAASASSAAAASRYAATAKAHPNTVVSSFACPTDAVVGGPDGSGPGKSNQETIDDPKSRQQQLWANFNSWGCDMPKASDNDDIANTLCGSIPPNFTLSLGIGKQPFWMNSSSHDADDKNCQSQFYNIAFTVKDKCEIPLTKDYCMSMYNNIKKSCPPLNPKSGANWEGGVVTDNCGVAYFTSGYDITQLTSSNHNPFFDLTADYWWDSNHLDCGPNGFKDPTYCPNPLAKPD